MPIPIEALELCGGRKNENDTVFVGVDNSQFCNTVIAEWVKKAGIAKEITFHLARHSFGMILLENDVDI